MMAASVPYSNAFASSIPDLIQSLRRVEFWLRLSRQGLAAAGGATLASLALIVFLMDHSPAGQSTMFTVSVTGLAIFGPLAPLVWRMKRRLWRTRNALHGRFYAAGLRVEADWRVVTNEPHPKLVHDGNTDYEAIPTVYAPADAY